MNKRNFDPIHPGEILLEEFLKPMEISQEQLAEDTSIPLPKISGIVQGKQDINAEIALRLGHFFCMEAQFWMNLQVRYDLILKSGRRKINFSLKSGLGFSFSGKAAYL